MIEDPDPKRIRWYADDFETTTDLDGEPLPYDLTPDKFDAYQTLPRAQSRLHIQFTPDLGVHTITVVRDARGRLSATYRTGRVRVWAWAIAPLDSEEVYTGTTLPGYVEAAADLGGIHWFHNLRFDGAFLDSYLFEPPPLGLGLVAGQWRSSQVPLGGCGVLISDHGAHYSRTVRLDDGRRFEVRDSLKKFPGTSVAQLAGMYGAEQGKGEIDYTAERPIGYLPTEEEWDYIRRDVSIPRTALRVAESLGNMSLTIGGDAMTEYRATMPGRFRAVFPLLDRDLDDWIRQAYRGGWTYVNPDYQGLVLESEGAVFDVNSMYPYVMRTYSYPIGEPARLAPGQLELADHPHVVYGALFDAKIKPGMLPTVQIKHDSRYDPVAYLTDMRGVEWYGTEVDWALLNDHYDVEIHEWIGGYAFRGRTGLFNRYIDKWMEVKERSEGGMRTQAKFQLNNLWGRFAINPLRAGRLPEIGDDGVVKYRLTPQEYGDPAYTPVGIWTTSYGRNEVIRAAQSFGSRFLSADTDSCHVIGTDPGTLDVHPTRLGAWKREAVFDRATYLRAKAYAERIILPDGSVKVEAHVAGLPRKLLAGARIEDIQVGARYAGKLVPRRVPGGIILTSTDFEIGEKDAWGYRS